MTPVLYSIGTLFTLLAIVLLYVAVLRDRSHGKPRCAKCWYDMRNLEEPKCPECGWTARKPRHQFRTRRHRRLAVLGVLWAFVAGASFVGPRVREHGALSIVPTTALLYFAPDAGDEFDPLSGELRAIPNELKRRAAHVSMTDWQWRMYIRRSRIIQVGRASDSDQTVLTIRRPLWFGGRTSVCAVDDRGYSFGDDSIYFSLPVSDPEYRRSIMRHGSFWPTVSYGRGSEKTLRTPTRTGTVNIRIDLWVDILVNPSAWLDSGHQSKLWQGELELVIPDFLNGT